MGVDHTMVTVGVLLALGLLAELGGTLTIIPAVLLAIGAGALAGPAALDLVDAPLTGDGVRLLLSIGVCFILFEGGLCLSVRVLRRVIGGLLALAVPGVLLSTVVVGAIAAAAFHVPLAAGLLVGAALAPTDPAVLIPVLRRMRVRPKVSETVVAESALNDPTAAVVAVTLAAVVSGRAAASSSVVVDFVQTLAVSVVFGIAVGWLLRAVLTAHRIGIWREAAPIAVAAVVLLGYPAAAALGGSGYLGAFVAGVLVGNLRRLPLEERHDAELRTVMELLARTAAMLIFVVLGANLPWSSIGAQVGPAVLVVATLMLVARPLVVLVCLGSDRRGGWTMPEIAFISWCRETGVLAAAIAGILAADGVPHADIVLASVGVAVLATIAVQTTTKAWLARRLRLVEPEPA